LKKATSGSGELTQKLVRAEHTGASKTFANSFPDPYSILFKALKSSVVQWTGRLDGPEIESILWLYFPHLFTSDLRPTQPSVIWEPGLFHGITRPLCGLGHPPPLEPRLKEE